LDNRDRININTNTNINMAPQLVLWKKRILVPFWAVRICICVLLILGYALLLSNLKEFADIEKPAVA
jgi:uncharacterized membrane protein